MANVSPHSPPTATTIPSFFLSQFSGHCLFRAAPVSAVIIIVVTVVVTVVVPPMQAAVNQVVDHDETNHPAEANKRNHPRVQRVYQGMSFFVVHLSAHQCVAILGPLCERVANVSQASAHSQPSSILRHGGHPRPTPEGSQRSMKNQNQNQAKSDMRLQGFESGWPRQEKANVL